jgi:hypothetical protein
MEFYNSNIQLDKSVIDDIFKQFTKDTRMLVFGLGHDSKMWYEGNKHTIFVENKEEYIKLGEESIPKDNIIQYEYKTLVETSFHLLDEDIQTYQIPDKLLELGPFDIILIDGPEGYSSTTPGRLIPCYWSTQLTKPGSVVYIDDSKRPLEAYCIEKYFKNTAKTIFDKRDSCHKIII